MAQKIVELAGIIDADKALNFWQKACSLQWSNMPVWVHGDFAIGNMLAHKGQLSAVIDFGGIAIGDPACDLVIAWTYLEGRSRDIFINEMGLDTDVWLRARAWALWKATFELCQIDDKNSSDAELQKRIIVEVLHG